MLKKLSVLAILCLFSGSANAIIIEYGDFTGSDVMYINVTEDTRMSPLALFGAPSIQGNTLDFDPNSFAATVSSTTGTSNTQEVEGRLSFTLMSNDNASALTNLYITEAGDYTLTGLGNATASASVSTPVEWAIIEVDGSPLTTAVSGQGDLVFTPNGGSYSLPADVGTGVLWEGELDVDIAGFAAANGITGAVTKVEFVMENVLTVTASDGGSAAIFKKDFNGVTISTIPEPSTFALFAMALFGLMAVRRLS